MSGDDPAGDGLPGVPGINEALRIISSMHRLRFVSKCLSRTSSVT